MCAAYFRHNNITLPNIYNNNDSKIEKSGTRVKTINYIYFYSLHYKKKKGTRKYIYTQQNNNKKRQVDA